MSFPRLPARSRAAALAALFALVLAHPALGDAPAYDWPKGSPRPFSIEEVIEIIRTGEGPVIIDARSGQEYRAGHVPTAFNVPHKETWGRIEEVRKFADRGIVYYCTKGVRAGIAADGLVLEGFPKVGTMTGHFLEWERRGLPLER